MQIIDYKMTLLGALIVILVGTMATAAIMSVTSASPQSIALVITLVTPSVIGLLGLIRTETTAKDVGVANEHLVALKDQSTEV